MKLHFDLIIRIYEMLKHCYVGMDEIQWIEMSFALLLIKSKALTRFAIQMWSV